MKKLITIILLFRSVLLFAQTDNRTITTYKDTLEYDIFHYNRYLGKTVILNTSGIEYKGEKILNDEMFRSDEWTWTYNFENKIYPAKNSHFVLADSLKNKEFTCIGLKNDGASIEMKLQNKVTGIFICRFLDKYCPFSTIDDIKKQDYLNANPCAKIEYQNDEIRDFKSYNTPIDIDASRIFWITKLIQLNKPAKYYIHIRVNEPVGKTVNGVYILLKNGKKISRPLQEIELEIDKEEESIIHPGYKQSAMIELNQADLLLLKSSPISKYAISYLTEELYDSDDLYKMFLCLLTKK